jgi:hypothetical protein
MFHWAQQLRIDPRQPRQRSRIQTVIFLSTFPDQPHIARMRHDHLVPEFAQQPAHPRRMHPGFQRNPAARHGSEHLPHRLRSCAQSLFQLHFARFV